MKKNKKTIEESKHIYIIENSEHRIKIGISKNVHKRVKTIQHTSGYQIINMFYTDKCSNSHELECKCHKHFKTKNTIGEWFDINFEVAKKYIENLKLEFDFKTEEEDKKDREKALEWFGNIIGI